MKKKHFLKGNVLPCIAVMIIAIGITALSCKKEAAQQQPVKNNLASIAGLLDGKLNSGTLACTDTKDELYLNFNNEKQILFIDKLPGFKTTLCGNLSKTEVLSSKYGFVIKDEATNKIWLLANNDKESLGKFEQVKQYLTGDFEQSNIFGFTIVNAPNS